MFSGRVYVPLKHQQQYQTHKVISQIRRVVTCIDIYPSSAKLAPFRRSGELWKGAEHEEITPISSTLVCRSGELWKGVVHEEITTVSSASSRRSGELWEGVVHEEVSPSAPQPSLD